MSKGKVDKKDKLKDAVITKNKVKNTSIVENKNENAVVVDDEVPIDNPAMTRIPKMDNFGNVKITALKSELGMTAGKEYIKMAHIAGNMVKAGIAEYSDTVEISSRRR